jgi:hydroxymethylbilane synthase
MSAPHLRIGTRGSELALWQAREVERRLCVPTVIVVIKTAGDQLRDIPLQGQSTTGFFTKDIERRLLAGEVDIAVHSLKDLPTTIDAGLEVAAVLPRAPVSDLLLVHPDWLDEAQPLLPLRPGCIVGAGSLRRQSLLRLHAPQVEPRLIRGNVPTRARKCREGEYGAVVLARAGVERLGLDIAPLLAWELSPDLWLPAPGQGAVAVEIRKGDEGARAAVAAIDDATTARAVELERRLLSRFEGGCHTAFGAHAVAVDTGLETGEKSEAAARGEPTWVVDLGIDRGASGWGQARFSGSFEECVALGPEVLPRLGAPTARSRDELCRPFAYGAER